ncbi:MAG: ROK family protein [Actinomycetota bacterium]|nr:ROK family protein [Actinomycetota bacterium]
MARALGIDVGGTKLVAGVVTDAGEVLTRRQAPTEGDDAEEVFARLASLIDDVRTGEEVACGVGCGGPMSPGGEEVSTLNIPAWRGFPLRRRLAESTHLPTFVDNDAKALAVGEGWVGAARDVEDFLAMVVSTGVGGGIVLNGRLLDGAEGNAGHIGHMIVEPGGRRCGCGAYGCLEACASGPSIEAITGRSPEEAPPEVVERTGTVTGRAIASVANLLDLRLAVVGGGVALGFGDPFFAAAQAEIDRCACLDFSAGARVVPAGLGSDGGLVGGARLGFLGLVQS